MARYPMRDLMQEWMDYPEEKLEPYQAVWLVHGDKGGIGRTSVARGLARALRELRFDARFVDFGNGAMWSKQWCEANRIEHVREERAREDLDKHSENRIWVVDVGRMIAPADLAFLIDRASAVITPLQSASGMGGVDAARQAARETAARRDSYQSRAEHFTLQTMVGQLLIRHQDTVMSMGLDEEEFPVFADEVDFASEAYIDRVLWDRRTTQIAREELRSEATRLLSSSLPARLFERRGRGVLDGFCYVNEGRLGARSFTRVAREVLWLTDCRLGPDYQTTPVHLGQGLQHAPQTYSSGADQRLQ